MRYEPATFVASGPQPGAVAVERYAINLGFGSAGIYNPRNIRGGSVLSLHAEGRAVDLTPGGRGSAALTDLVHRLIDHHVGLGVQQIIWQRASWRVGRTWQPYNGVDPHTSHAHVELTRHAAATLTVDGVASALEGTEDMTPDESRMLQQIHRAIFTGLNPDADHIGYAVLATNYVVQQSLTVDGKQPFLPGQLRPSPPVDVAALVNALAPMLVDAMKHDGPLELSVIEAAVTSALSKIRVTTA